jgi:hypothetical protein
MLLFTFRGTLSQLSPVTPAVAAPEAARVLARGGAWWCPPTAARGVATGGRQLGPDTPRRPMARWHPAPGSTARAPAGAEVYCSPVRAEGVQTVIQAFGVSGEEVWPHLTVEVPRACGTSSLTVASRLQRHRRAKSRGLRHDQHYNIIECAQEPDFRPLLSTPATRANGSHQTIMKSSQGRFGRKQNLWIFLTSTGISWRTPRLSRDSAWGGWYRQRCQGGRTRNGG